LGVVVGGDLEDLLGLDDTLAFLVLAFLVLSSVWVVGFFLNGVLLGILESIYHETTVATIAGS